MIVDLHLRGDLVIIVGGGSEAIKKINALRTQDCRILVISDKINSQIKKLINEKKIKFKKKLLTNANFLTKYKPYLVMATTDDKLLNRKIVKKAKAMNCLAYAADDPEVSDFAHPSVINLEDTVQIAISTGGRSPAMARKLKIQAEKIFKKIIKKEDLHQIKLQEVARKAVKNVIPDQKDRKKFLYSVLNDKKIKVLIKDDNLRKAEQRVITMLREWR